MGDRRTVRATERGRHDLDGRVPRLRQRRRAVLDAQVAGTVQHSGGGQRSSGGHSFNWGTVRGKYVYGGGGAVVGYEGELRRQLYSLASAGSDVGPGELRKSQVL